MLEAQGYIGVGNPREPKEHACDFLFFNELRSLIGRETTVSEQQRVLDEGPVGGDNVVLGSPLLA